MKPLKLFKKSHGLCLIFLMAIALPVKASEDEFVRQTFSNYKTAILSGDGKVAVEQVDQKTINYYGQMQQLAVCANPNEVKDQPIVNRLQIFNLRFRVPSSLLLGMSKKDVFVYAVTQGWIGKNSVSIMNLGDVEISGNIATAEMLQDNQPSDLDFHFVKENGEWKLDLIPILNLSNNGLTTLAQRQGIPENDLLLLLLESATGQRPTETIWQPIAPSSPLCQ